MSYEKKLVTFIDILGFKNLITSSFDNADRKDHIHIALSDLCSQVENWQNHCNDGSRKWFNFSDCIALTANDTIAETKTLIKLIKNLQFNLLNKKILLRGGIVLGDIFDYNKFLYGPGLVEAYLSESKNAVFPRILVANDIIKRKDSAIMVLPLAKDIDNRFFVDYLHPGKAAEVTHDSIVKYQNIQSFIEEQVKNLDIRKNIPLYHKYYWLMSYFNTRIPMLNRHTPSFDLPEFTPYVEKRFTRVLIMPNSRI